MNPTPVISKIFTFTSFCFTKFPHCANHSGMIALNCTTLPPEGYEEPQWLLEVWPKPNKKTYNYVRSRGVLRHLLTPHAVLFTMITETMRLMSAL